MKNKEITVLDQAIHINKDDYFSLTDIARYKNPDAPADVVKNWLRRKDTIEFIGLWERLNNPDFNVVEFDQFKNEAGHNYFTLSPKKWIEGVNAIGLVSKAGKYNAGTYAHKDIALQFASWISPEINLYMEYEGKHCLDDVLQLYRSCNIKVLNIQITRSAENGEHNACAIFTLRLPRSCGVEKLLTLVGRREGIVSVEEL